MRKAKLTYRITTGLLTAMLVPGAIMYFAKYAMVSESFTALGYPTHIIYPLAIAKLLAVVAIWSRKSELLKELAYAGLFYDLILAVTAHLVAQDGEFAPALVGLVLTVVSYAAQRRVWPPATVTPAADQHKQPIA